MILLAFLYSVGGRREVVAKSNVLEGIVGQALERPEVLRAGWEVL